MTAPTSRTAAQQINQDSGNVEFYTPAPIVEAARLTLGAIDLDPASSEIANKTIRAWKIYTNRDNGLAQPWFGNVWLNHPFSRQENTAWIEKAISEHKTGHAAAICLICYAATSEAWFRPLLSWPQCYLYPRTNYRTPDGKIERGVTKGSVVTYLGPAVYRFAASFSTLGTVKIALADLERCRKAGAFAKP